MTTLLFAAIFGLFIALRDGAEDSFGLNMFKVVYIIILFFVIKLILP